jgi:hypothetical protein
MPRQGKVMDRARNLRGNIRHRSTAGGTPPLFMPDVNRSSVCCRFGGFHVGPCSDRLGRCHFISTDLDDRKKRAVRSASSTAFTFVKFIESLDRSPSLTINQSPILECILDPFTHVGLNSCACSNADTISEYKTVLQRSILALNESGQCVPAAADVSFQLSAPLSPLVVTVQLPFLFGSSSSHSSSSCVPTRQFGHSA